MNIPKLIFIRSLGHSGSTILGQLICNEHNFVSLGEVATFIRYYDEGYLSDTRNCSCGETYHTCDFWGDLLRNYQEDKNMKDKYLHTILLAHKKYKRPIVDISKNDDAYEIVRRLEAENKIDLAVVYIFRDARGWVNSYLIREEKNGLLKALKLFRVWYVKNKKLFGEWEDNKTKHTFLTSYEKIAFQKKHELNLEHLEKHNEGPAIHHITTGNLKSVGTESDLRYDYRWLANTKIGFVYSLLPMVQKLNKKIIFDELIDIYNKSLKKVQL